MGEWSLHPRYLDARGLVALWREGLLAQKVLAGETRGYRNHPQLERFRAQTDAELAIAAYLQAVWEEAVRRGYKFDRGKILCVAGSAPAIEVTDGQVRYELGHLAGKLEGRDRDALEMRSGVSVPEVHPSFVMIEGEVESWERVSAESLRLAVPTD